MKGHSFFPLFLFLAASAQQHSIPADLRAAIEKSMSFGDLVSKVPVFMQRAASSGGVHDHGLKIESASITRNGASSHRRVLGAQPASHKEEADWQKEQLMSIRQGSDTCQLQAVCVPVESAVEVDDESIVLYPTCYDVQRCVGSCCKAGNQCHAHSNRTIQKLVVELKYIGNDKFKTNRTFNISMIEHTSCSCYRCPAVTKPCPDNLAIGPSCNCECPNQQEKQTCTGDRRWHEETCSCACPLVVCRAHQTFDRATCSCRDRVELTVAARQLAPDEELARDIANLPKLSSRHKLRRGPAN